MNGAVENQLVNKWKASEGRSLLQMATGYKSSKDIPPLTSMSREKVHNALLAAGMTPGLGNIADAADALLYAAEGEFGSAGLSAAAMTPMVGQLVSAKRALKAAKKSGEKMITFYRGVDKWYPSKHALTAGKYEGKTIKTGDRMVKDGKFVGKGYWVASRGPKDAILVTGDVKYAKRYKQKAHTGKILEFEIPESYVLKNYCTISFGDEGSMGIFSKGIPKEFLKKVHK